MKTLFENKRQALKVRLILWMAIILALVALYSGWVIFSNYGLSAVDGSVLKPFSTRLAFGGGIALAGCAFAGSMMLYATLYLLKLERDGDKVMIRTLSAFGLRSKQITFNTSDIKRATYFQGKQNLDISVNAPWVKLNISDRKLPFIIDLKADTIRLSELKKMAKF